HGVVSEITESEWFRALHGFGDARQASRGNRKIVPTHGAEKTEDAHRQEFPSGRGGRSSSLYGVAAIDGKTCADSVAVYGNSPRTKEEYMAWPALCGEKLVTPEQALEIVQPIDRVFIVGL